MHTFHKLLAISSLLTASMFMGCIENGKPIAYATFSMDMTLVTSAKTEMGSTYTASNGDQIRIDSLDVEIESIELISAATTTGTADEFDPTNPPAPFTNCHGGHCHSTESDALYTFDEIKQILADKASGKTTVLQADVEKSATLSTLNQGVSLSNIADGDLGETTLSEFRIKLGEIHFKGHNITKDIAIDINNHHEEEEDEEHDHDHEDHDHEGHEHEHSHIDMISLSHALSRTINRKSDYKQEFHGIISIDAAFIEAIIAAEGDIDFADIISDQATLEMADE